MFYYLLNANIRNIRLNEIFFNILHIYYANITHKKLRIILLYKGIKFSSIVQNSTS